jgi:hypothetical protein
MSVVPSIIVFDKVTWSLLSCNQHKDNTKAIPATRLTLIISSASHILPAQIHRASTLVILLVRPYSCTTDWIMLLLKVSIIAAQAQVAFSSATTLAAKPTKPSKPTVYFIRHGEKPEIGDGLSTDGLQRAECLRNVFGKNSSFSINHIIAQRPQPGMSEF